MTRDQLAGVVAAVLEAGGTVSFPYKPLWSAEVVRVEAYRRGDGGGYEVRDWWTGATTGHASAAAAAAAWVGLAYSPKNLWLVVDGLRRRGVDVANLPAATLRRLAAAYQQDHLAADWPAAVG